MKNSHTRTIINSFIQLALKIINKIKTFILHSLKFAAVCIHSGASKNVLGVEDISLVIIFFI